MTTAVDRVDTSQKLLWVDDHADSLKSLQSAIANLGHEVRSISSIEEIGVDTLAGYSNFIVDNKLGSNLSAGLDLSKRLITREHTKVIMFSAYLTIDEVEKGIYIDPKSHSKILYAPKKSVPVNEVGQWMTDTAQSFDHFLRHGELRKKNLMSEGRNNANDVYTYTQYSVLSLMEKAKYYKRFEEKNKKQIGEYFIKGAIWLLFFEGDDSPEVVAYSEEEIIPQTSIARQAEALDRVPFVFRNNINIDDNSCTPKGKRKLNNYPYIVVSMGDADIPIHFDTGADASLLNARFVGEVSFSKVLGEESLNLHGQYHLAEIVELDIVLRRDELRSGGYGISMRAYSVSEWEGSKLFIECSKDCKQRSDKIRGCIYRRNGLVGRDLYTNTDISITLAGRENRVQVRKYNK